ncbi:MAG: tRNA (guanosine(46)-N7)-methyltransferase TrmB [Synergistaceae bacterium]|nr:tRNA (guanosine(46)-N7)-methyltransferase TrmB [Synergistaceae bacterium]
MKLTDKIIVLPEKEKLPLAMDRGRAPEAVFLEIGFGNGEFLEALARNSPDAVFWGAEMSGACLVRALRRAGRRGLGNLFLVCADARFFLRECVPAASLDGIYMNFPCPWPKKKHARRRVSKGDFPSEIARTLKTGGFFELVTDEEWYGEEVRDALASCPGLAQEAREINPPRPVKTKYERKWLEMGKNIYMSRFVKPAPWGGERDDFIGRADDVHLCVPGRADLDFALRGLKNVEGRAQDGFWVYKRAYSSGEDARLIEVVSGDGAFEQKFFLQAIQRDEDILVKTSPYSTPFLTPAVRGAMEGLAERLREATSSR